MGGKQKIKHAGLQADGGYDVGKTWSDSLLKVRFECVRVEWYCLTFVPKDSTKSRTTGTETVEVHKISAYIFSLTFNQSPNRASGLDELGVRLLVCTIPSHTTGKSLTFLTDRTLCHLKCLFCHRARIVMQLFVVEQRRPRHFCRIALTTSSTQVKDGRM